MLVWKCLLPHKKHSGNSIHKLCKTANLAFYWQCDKCTKSDCPNTICNFLITKLSTIITCACIQSIKKPHDSTYSDDVSWYHKGTMLDLWRQIIPSQRTHIQVKYHNVIGKWDAWVYGLIKIYDAWDYDTRAQCFAAPEFSSTLAA